MTVGLQVSVAQANNSLLGQPTVTMSPWTDSSYSTSGGLSSQATISSPSAPYNVNAYYDYDWCQAQTNTNTTTNEGAHETGANTRDVSQRVHARSVIDLRSVCGTCCCGCQDLRCHGLYSNSMAPQTHLGSRRATGTAASSAAMLWTHAPRCQAAPTRLTSSVPTGVSTHTPPGSMCMRTHCRVPAGDLPVLEPGPRG